MAKYVFYLINIIESLSVYNCFLVIKRSRVGKKTHFSNKFDSLERMCSLQMMTCHQILLFIQQVVPLRTQLAIVTSIEHVWAKLCLNDDRITMSSKN